MPGTTRYSATFDRTYEEDAKPSSPPNARRSRSQSWQASSGHNGRQYTPFASRSPAPRSSSTDNSPNNGTEFIPTRTAKTSVKAHNNPFQFVKVGTCPLYKKAEEQLKKAKEIKKPDVLKEEEEEWQSNLDSWKSRRRKMSEDVFRRQEELKLLELEEQIAQVSNKKTKTFSEMVESRATRGRALSLCLLTSPLDFQSWEFENKSHKNGSCSYTDESGDNSIVNSEDEGVSVRGRHGETSFNDNETNNRTNGDAHIEQNGNKLDKQNENCSTKISNGVQLKPKENSYIDSGLESISSSHRAGDTPDSGSDFSQDSNSSIDCDSPRTGVNVLEEFSSKSSQISEGHKININLKLDEKGQDFGFTFLGGKDEGQVIIASILEGSKAESSGMHLGDRIITIDGCDVNSKKHIEIASLIQKGREKSQLSLLLWRHNKTASGTNGFKAEEKHNKIITDANSNSKSHEKSIESENEMFVDDFEELKRQSELLANKKSITNGNVQENENKPSIKDAISLKTSFESSTASIPKINTSNSAVEDANQNEKKAEINENQKKNVIKVKRVRRKGVYALNVDSNQISQDGNSTNLLFPLSPVTELPSPADETKTMSSTLSSNNTLPDFSSQNGISVEGKQKDVEAKLEIPMSKENYSVTPTSTNTDNFKPTVPQTDLKNIENGIQLNVEDKTETVNAPASKNKDSQDEKSKLQSTPKKAKPCKLKKGITSESSVATECTKELSSSDQCNDVTSKSVTQSKSSHTLENRQLDTKNDIKNPAASETMANNISSKNISVTQATAVISAPIKTHSTCGVSNGVEIQSTKIVTNNVEAPAISREPKISISEDNKPKKNIQKKFVKSKDATTEKTSAGATLNEIYSTKNQKSSSVMKKQEKMDSKTETAVPSLKEENIVSSNRIANMPQEIYPSSAKDEDSIPCPSTNKVKDLALKFGVKKSSANSESPLPTKNAMILKTSLNEKAKPENVEKKEIIKAKENCLEQNLTGSPVALSSVSNSFDSSSKNMTLPNMEKQVKIAIKEENVVASSKRATSDAQAPLDNKQVATNSTSASTPNAYASDSPSSKNSVKGIQQKKATSLSQDEQTKTVVKTENVSPLSRGKDKISLDIGVIDATTVDKHPQKLPSPAVPSNNPTSILTSINKSESNTVTAEISLTKDSVPKSPVNSPDEKSKLPAPKRSRNRSKKKSANSQKVTAPVKSNEESKLSNNSLNVVFHSQPKNMGSGNINNNNNNFENNTSRTSSISAPLVTDVPPVDKIAEEMEKLILEQLEEEERAKELSSGKVLVESSPEHLLTAPPRLAEPPKEKPPPPPSSETPKDSSLKRVNSTKRIKKEIYKRRSNFLGIENADESIICNEPSVPPPPALEEILKAEMELDRQTRLRIENEATERLTLEEKEIMQKEREILESLESEERRKMYMNGIEDVANDAVCEQDHIEFLKCTRKRVDTELQLSEEQQQILIEEKQLKEREEFIRQQEAAISTVPLSDSSLSVSANTANLKQPALSSVPTEVQSNGLLFGTNGDGNGLALSSSTEVSVNEFSKGGKKINASEKPAVPPKPLKKKEAIRKERERLRQEQEALQREREEHRRKLMLEQEELMKQQKTHAPDAPASRLGPHPPHVQPSFPSQLTTIMNANPNARENVSVPSRSHHGATNSAAGSINAVELMGPPVVRQNVRPAPRKAAQNEAWGQQKMSSVRKQNHEPLTESRYNQNHWLIQEAEMRRIAELKERQRIIQPSCSQTHLAEDDVCSNPPRVPVISPTHNPHLNYPMQEKVWNYGQSNMPLKKYPPPVVKEPPLHTIYPRETVPQQPPSKPSRVVPSDKHEQMLSVSGRKRCSHCNEELGRGAAMIIESLQLYYHIHCFQCCVCQAQLGNGSCGTDVRVRNNKLHCHNCYSNDEAGLKFSQV